MVDSIWPEGNGGNKPLPAPNVVVARAGARLEELPPEAVKGILVSPIYTGIGLSPGWSRTPPGSGPAPS